MTRFARAKGSKASNEKVPEAATSWAEMKQQMQEKHNNVEEDQSNEPEVIKKDVKLNDSQEENTKSQWADFEDKVTNKKNKTKPEKRNLKGVQMKKSKIIETCTEIDSEEKKTENINDGNKSSSARSIRKRKYNEERVNHFKEIREKKKILLEPIIVHGKEVEVVKFYGYPVKKEDADRLLELRAELIKKGVPQKTINETMVVKRRQAEKALARAKKAVCFNCRQKGHQFFDCPETTSDKNIDLPKSGICFKCGSTEHTHFQCKVVKGIKYSFAVCFICKEQGHISSQCPDNSYGIYPNGGACNVCGDVTHLKRDCPTFRAEKVVKELEVETIDYKNIEALEPNKTKSIVCNKPPTVKRVKY